MPDLRVDFIFFSRFYFSHSFDFFSPPKVYVSLPLSFFIVIYYFSWNSSRNMAAKRWKVFHGAETLIDFALPKIYLINHPFCNFIRAKPSLPPRKSTFFSQFKKWWLNLKFVTRKRLRSNPIDMFFIRYINFIFYYEIWFIWNSLKHHYFIWLFLNFLQSICQSWIDILLLKV